MTKSSKKSYDLEDRTAKFGEDIIELCKKIPNNDINSPLVRQIVKSGTSVGANYLEANGASSKKDFRNKIFICKKESQETRHWLRILAKSCDDEIYSVEFRRLWQEAKELSMIFHKIVSTIDKK
jgi:four helix bundle protein